MEIYSLIERSCISENGFPYLHKRYDNYFFVETDEISELFEKVLDDKNSDFFNTLFYACALNNTIVSKKILENTNEILKYGFLGSCLGPSLDLIKEIFEIIKNKKIVLTESIISMGMYFASFVGFKEIIDYVFEIATYFNSVTCFDYVSNIWDFSLYGACSSKSIGGINYAKIKLSKNFSRALFYICATPKNLQKEHILNYMLLQDIKSYEDAFAGACLSADLSLMEFIHLKGANDYNNAIRKVCFYGNLDRYPDDYLRVYEYLFIKIKLVNENWIYVLIYGHYILEDIPLSYKNLKNKKLSKFLKDKIILKN